MVSRVNVAVVGATGMVGREMLKVLDEVAFPIDHLYCLASARSAGKSIDFQGKQMIVEDLATFDFSKVDIALFSAGGAISEVYAPKAVEAGAVVIDNTSHFRYDEDVPLVVPGVNDEVLEGFTTGIIANPNCSTIQMLLALHPLHQHVGLKRINIATYQSVSGAGQSAVEELLSDTESALEGCRGPLDESSVPRNDAISVAFNVVPQIDVMLENGYTKEEMKMVWETHKIFGDESIEVNPTAVRVPVLKGHSEVVSVELVKPLSASDAKELFKVNQRLRVFDGEEIPTPRYRGDGGNDVCIGRIRNDLSHANILNLWIVSDNLRTGAALNAVLIAQRILKMFD